MYAFSFLITIYMCSLPGAGLAAERGRAAAGRADGASWAQQQGQGGGADRCTPVADTDSPLEPSLFPGLMIRT